MRASWSPLAWAKSVPKDQDVSKPKAIPEDCICLGEYTSDALVCATSRTENTDFDADSPYSGKLVSSTNDFSNDTIHFGALTSRTDDTDDGSPSRIKQFTRCSTRDLVDICDQRTEEVEELLKVGRALISEKHPRNIDVSSCDTTPANRLNSNLNTSRWESLHDEANVYLNDIHNRLVTMSKEPVSADTCAAGTWEGIEDEGDLAAEVQELRKVVEGLVRELGEVRQGEAAMKEEITMLRDRVARVDRQAAKACSDVEDLRQDQGSALQKTDAASPTSGAQAAPPKPQEATAVAENVQKPAAPKIGIQACSDRGPTQPSKPKIPLLKLPGSNNRQLAGSHTRLQQRGAPQINQPSRAPAGQTFFRK